MAKILPSASGEAEVFVQARSKYYNHETGEEHNGEFHNHSEAFGEAAKVR